MAKQKGLPGFRTTTGLPSRAAVRFLTFAVLWFILTDLDLHSWLLGLPFCTLATGVSLLLAPEPRPLPSLGGCCLFVPFFLGKSLQSGFDVMRRTLALRPLVNPGLISYTTTLPQGAPRILFANTISLLPGTLSADLEGDRVIVHAIDQDLPVWAALQLLEERIALIFMARQNQEQRG